MKKILIFLMLLFCSLGTDAQDIVARNQVRSIPLNYQIGNLARLNDPNAFYSYLWIFEDGNFTPKDHFPNHNRVSNNMYSGVGDNKVYAYYLDHYSQEGPPPERIDGNFNNGKTIFNHPVPINYDSKDINIQLFPENIRPTDPFQVAIISFKNTTSEQLSGQLLLEYNDPLQKIENGVQTRVTGQKGNFGHTTANNIPLFYKNTQFLGLKNGINPNGFSKGLVWDFSELKPNEERRIFVELQGGVPNHPLLNHVSTYDKSQSPIDSTIYFLNFKASISTGSDFSTDNDPNYSTDIATQTSAIFDTDNAVARIVGAHDPNALKIATCDCTSNKRTYIADLTFTNDGTLPTSFIDVELEFAPQYDLNTLQLDSSTLNPAFTFTPNIDLSANTVTWQSTGTLLKPYESSDNSTIGHIKFSIQTFDGVQVSEIDPMKAGIRFIDNNIVNREYTNEAQPYLLHEGEAYFNDLACLKCSTQECKKKDSDRTPTDCKYCIDHIWQYLLLAFVLILLFIWWLCKRRT